MRESFSNGVFGIMLSVAHRERRATERAFPFGEKDKGMRRKWCGGGAGTVWAIGAVGMPLRIYGRGLASERERSKASRWQLFCFKI